VKSRYQELLHVEDIAPAAVFVASSDAGWITGETSLIAAGYR
jgi:NAD(P)-dependent dehydrogenase (short-subunit alcohol dehydrogenase family)